MKGKLFESLRSEVIKAANEVHFWAATGHWIEPGGTGRQRAQLAANRCFMENNDMPVYQELVRRVCKKNGLEDPVTRNGR